VRLLLATRCRLNQVIFDALVRRVGAEPRASGGGGAVTVVTANSLTASPSNTAAAAGHAVAAAAARVKQRGLPTWLALAGAGLLLVRGLASGLLGGLGGGGGGGGRGGRHGGDRSGDRSSSRRGAGGVFDDPGRLQALSAECIAAAAGELAKARRNEALLQHDWRVGTATARLKHALTGSSLPPGYEPVDYGAADVARFNPRAASERPFGSD